MNTFKTTALVLSLVISANAFGMHFDRELAHLSGLTTKEAIETFEEIENELSEQAISTTHKKAKTPTIVSAIMRRQPTTPAADITKTFRPVSRAAAEELSAPASRAATSRPASATVLAAREAKVDERTGQVSSIALIQARAALAQ